MTRQSHRLLEILLFSSLAFSPTLAEPAPRPGDLGSSPLPVGASGIAWYATWDSAWREAQRSNRPIMFVAAATQCSGISGVF